MTITKIYHEKLRGVPDAPSDRTFARWVASGTKFATVAAGGTYNSLHNLLILTHPATGSVYMLLLLSMANMRTTLAQLPGDFPNQLANVLRRPNLCKICDCLEPRH